MRGCAEENYTSAHLKDPSYSSKRVDNFNDSQTHIFKITKMMRDKGHRRETLGPYTSWLPNLTLLNKLVFDSLYK